MSTWLDAVGDPGHDNSNVLIRSHFDAPHQGAEPLAMDSRRMAGRPAIDTMPSSSHGRSGFTSPPHRSHTARSCARPTNRYQETRSSLSGNTVQPHAGVGGITGPFLHVPRYGGYRATLIGWAAGMERKTCANQRPHLPLRSSAF